MACSPPVMVHAGRPDLPVTSGSGSSSRSVWTCLADKNGMFCQKRACSVVPRGVVSDAPAPSSTLHHRSTSQATGSWLVSPRVPCSRMARASGMPFGPKAVRHLARRPSARRRFCGQRSDSDVLASCCSHTFDQESRPAAPRGKRGPDAGEDRADGAEVEGAAVEASAAEGAGVRVTTVASAAVGCRTAPGTVPGPRWLLGFALVFARAAAWALRCRYSAQCSSCTESAPPPGQEQPLAG